MDTNQKSPTGGYVHFVKTAPKSDKQRIAELTEQRDELLAEIEKLQAALFFWMPRIPACENECTDRMANDAALLIDYEGPIDDSAEQRGWLTLEAIAKAEKK